MSSLDIGATRTEKTIVINSKTVISRTRKLLLQIFKCKFQSNRVKGLKLHVVGSLIPGFQEIMWEREVK